VYNRRRRKLYLAACFHRREEMRKIREALWRIGYDVLSSWLDEVADPGDLTRGEKAAIAEKCRFEIERVSVVVCFIHPLTKDCIASCGHQVEFGFALAKGKQLISVGSATRNIFHEDWRVRQFATIEAFLAAAELWKNFLPPPESLAK